MKGFLGNIAREGFVRLWQQRAMTAVLALVLFFFPFSLLFVAGGLLPERFSWMASVIIFLNGAATFFSELRLRSVPAVAATFMILAGGLFFIELLGVRTGFPFGHLLYGMQCILFAATNLAHGHAFPVLVVLTILTAGFVVGLPLHTRGQPKGALEE